MKLVFVSVGTSLFDRSLLGPREVFRPLRGSAALAAWDEAGEDAGSAELPAAEAERRLDASVKVASGVTEVLEGFPERVLLLRDAFVVAGDEDEKKMLSAELASLCGLLPRYPLANDDRLVLLATDSPEGRLAGDVLGRVLDGHPELHGAEVEAVWPRHWQAHDVLRLTDRGAANLLAAVSRRMAADLRATPLFVVTGGLKLGITVLCQVSCWSQSAEQGGLFWKLEDPGGVFFPPSRFVQRTEGHVLMPHLPTEELRGEVPYTARLHEVVETMDPPSGGGPAPVTTLVVTAGVGLVRVGYRKELLQERFGPSSRLADEATWRELDQHWQCRDWDELRSVTGNALSRGELEEVLESVLGQLRRAWNEDRSRDLPAEVAALRSLWGKAGRSPAPLLRGRLQVVLLATDSLTGEYCASVIADFLKGVEGIAEVQTQPVPGFHPFGELSKDGEWFLRMAEIVAAAAQCCERLLMVPLGGTKLHLPLLTVLATRLHAPVILGHAGLERPVSVPWLESDGERVWGGTEGMSKAWPELVSFPTVRLLVDCQNG